MSHIADKLAFENDLCRRTTSVTRDTKRSQLIVVEEIRKNGKDDSYRSEVYYHFADDVENSHVNKIIDTAKAIATFKFLGRRMKDALEVTTAPVAEVVATGEDLGTPVPAKVEEKKPVKKKATKKKATKAVKVEAEAAIEPEAVYEAVEEEVAPVTVEVKAIMFNKAEREHRSYLSPIIQKALGKNWKEDDSNMTKVQELIGSLQGKVPVCDSTGEQLDSFADAVTNFLTL